MKLTMIALAARAVCYGRGGPPVLFGLYAVPSGRYYPEDRFAEAA